MAQRVRKVCVIMFVFLATVCSAADSPESPLPEKENFHLYLLVGQSNMAGRGTVEDQDKVPHPRVLTLDKENQWVPAVDPIHFDKPQAGVCLARTFGIVLADASPDITIGLIPCAVGGSPIRTWQPRELWEQTGAHPYDDMLSRAQVALKDGVLKGILWHQGESDSNEKYSGVYKEKLIELIARFRKDLNAPNVPFIMGEMGHFADRPWSEYKKAVDQAQQEIAKEIPNCGYVSSEGLTWDTDDLHFDAKSLREFGKRYVEVYREVDMLR